MRFNILLLASLATAVHVTNVTSSANRLNSTVDAKKADSPAGAAKVNSTSEMGKMLSQFGATQLDSTIAAKAKADTDPKKVDADRAKGMGMGKGNMTATSKSKLTENAKKIGRVGGGKSDAKGTGTSSLTFKAGSTKNKSNGNKGTGSGQINKTPDKNEASRKQQGSNKAESGAKETESIAEAAKQAPTPGVAKYFSNSTFAQARNNSAAASRRLNALKTGTSSPSKSTQPGGKFLNTTDAKAAEVPPPPPPPTPVNYTLPPTNTDASAPNLETTGVRDDPTSISTPHLAMTKATRRSAFLTPNGTVDHTGLQSFLSLAAEKYASRSTRRGFVRRQTTGSGSVPLVVNVVNQQGLLFDSFYYGLGTVGGGSDPTQQFQFDFDTGSADTWVPGPKCTEADGCPGDVKYDELGKSANKTAELTYGIGSATGVIYKDDVSVGGLTATNQTFLSVSSATSFDEPDNNGILGLAFSEIAVDNGTSFFETLIKQGRVQEPEFSFYLARGSAGEGGSQLTLGGRDASKYTGESTTIPVTQRGFWQVDLEGVSVGDNGTVAGSGAPAIIDTGSSLITGPVAAVKNIYAAIPGARAVTGSGGTEYEYPCNTTSADIPSLEFAGKPFAIAPEDFNLGKADDSGDYCVGAIVGLDLGLYTVGDVFLKNWYSTYSYNAAGGEPAVILAQAV